MPNRELLDYITKQHQQGVSRDNIKKALVDVGWQQQEVEEALNSVLAKENDIPPPPTTASELPDVDQILKRAWSIYKDKVKLFAGIMLIPFAWGVIPYILLSIVKNMDTSDLSAVFIRFFLVGGILYLLILMVISVWGQVSLFVAIRDREERIGVIEAYRRGGKKLLSYIWLSIIGGIITFVGFLFFIVPGIIFAIWFSFAWFILVVEDVKGMNALLKSKEYIRNKWWEVFGRLILVMVLVWVINMAVVLVLSPLFMLIPVSVSIGSQLVSVLTAPFATTYAFLLYKDVRSLKGELYSFATEKQKIIFILIAVLGLLLPLILVASILGVVYS